MLHSLIENFLQLEITQIVVLQQIFKPLEPFLAAITHFANAEYLHIYVLPFIAAFRTRSYIKAFTALICSELLCNWLKWLIHEDRPYWWVMETKSYTHFVRPVLEQTSLTCETSSGSPSGHAMMFSTVLFVIMQDSLRLVDKNTNSSKTVKYCSWNTFLSLVTLVCISRMYFACHFFHQCLFGVVIGIFVGYCIRRKDIYNHILHMRPLRALLIYISLMLLTVCIYFALLLFEIDPQWSVRKAFNWCTDPFLVKPETTTMYSLVRLFGLLFGMVLCAPLIHKCQHERLRLEWSLPVVIVLMIINHIIHNNIPRWRGFLIFYSYLFAANMFFAIELFMIVPYIGKRIVFQT